MSFWLQDDILCSPDLPCVPFKHGSLTGRPFWKLMSVNHLERAALRRCVTNWSLKRSLKKKKAPDALGSIPSSVP